MSQQVFTRSSTILKRINQSDGNPIKIYQPGILNYRDRSNISRFYGFLTDLRAKIDIHSLPEVGLPNLEATQSRVERITAVRDAEWQSNRYEMEILLQTSTQSLTPIAALSLLNRVPYYQVNLLGYMTDNGVFMIANDAALYVRLKNVGYGLPKVTDEVVIFGSAKEEAYALPEPAEEITYSQAHAWTLNDTSMMILPPNADRKQLTLVNRGGSTVYITYGTVAELDSGIALMPLGGSYEINSSNPYKGMISAIAESETFLSGLECV